MSKCPYTWVRNLLTGGGRAAAAPGEPARHLMVRVMRAGEERVSVSLPAKSARWLIELIPADVVEKIRAERIPLDAMLAELNTQAVLYPRPVFSLHDADRQVDIWLE